MPIHKTMLSTADVARLFDVTGTTIKRWANDGMLKCMKTPGGHRKYEMKHVVEFARRLQWEPACALALTDQDALDQTIQVAILTRDFAALRRLYIEKALSPDKCDLVVFFSYIYQHQIDLWEMYDLIIAPGMMGIGERWARGDVKVCHEHRASHETLDALARLQAQIHVMHPTGLGAVCACVGNELHEISLRCAASLCDSEGWLTHYLGPRTPFEEVVYAVEELNPTAVCISRTVPFTDDAEREAWNRMLRTLLGNGITILLGGKALCGQRTTEARVHQCSTLRELLTFLKRRSYAGPQTNGGQLEATTPDQSHYRCLKGRET